MNVGDVSGEGGWRRVWRLVAQSCCYGNTPPDVCNVQADRIPFAHIKKGFPCNDCLSQSFLWQCSSASSHWAGRWRSRHLRPYRSSLLPARSPTSRPASTFVDAPEQFDQVLMIIDFPAGTWPPPHTPGG